MATYSSGLLVGTSPNRHRLDLIVNQNSQNQGTNQSTVGWELRLVHVSGTPGSFNGGTSNWSRNIGGAASSGTTTYDFRNNVYGYQVLASGTNTFTHGADGYLTIAVSGSFSSPGNHIGNGSVSGSFTLTRIPKAPAAPGAPTVGTVTPTTVALTWTAPDNMGSAITGYTVQYATSSDFTTGVGTQSFTSLSGTVTGLSPGNTYWFRVRATNAVGTGSHGAASSTAVGLPAPTLTSWTQNTGGNLVAAWTAPSPATGLTGYRVQVATNAGFTENVANIDVGDVLTYTVTGLTGGRYYWVRVAARTAGGVNTYSSSLNTILILDAGNLDGWTRVGTKPSQISYYTSEGIRRGTIGGVQALFLESLSTATVTLPADTFGMQRTVTGLTIGKAYRFEANGTLNGAPLADLYKLTVVDEDDATPVTVTTDTSLGHVEFVADDTTVIIQILLADEVNATGAQQVESVAFHTIRLLELDTDYPQRLRSTVYESNLANHLDLACNSVGATWYVAKDGVTRFRLPGATLPVTAVFSDETSPSYVDIVAGFDTRTTVNRIEATNYGMDPTEDEEANDELIVEDPTSQAAYGVYRTTLALNLYDEAPYDESFQDRLDQLLTGHASPVPLVSQIRWNAQQNLELAAELEVFDRIIVRYRGLDYDSQIVAIQHDLTPTRWMVTLDLQPLTEGAS